MQYLAIISERNIFAYRAGLVPDKEKSRTASMCHHEDIVFKVTVFLHKHFACRWKSLILVSSDLSNFFNTLAVSPSWSVANGKRT